MNKKYPYEFIRQIDNKCLNQLSNKNKELIKQLFIDVNENEIIKIEKIYKSKKSLISIKVNQQKEYINILFKNYHIIAEPSITQFVNLLKSKNINKKIIDDLLFLLWGDLTYNNTGTVRYDSNTIYTNYFDKLSLVNEKLNQIDILKTIFLKYLFSDENITKRINYLLYKVNDEWKIISFEKLINKIENTQYKNNKIIYVGPLIIQNKARNINFKKEYESYRNHISIRWYYYNKYLL